MEGKQKRSSTWNAIVRVGDLRRTEKHNREASVSVKRQYQVQPIAGLQCQRSHVEYKAPKLKVGIVHVYLCHIFMGC